MLIRILKYKKFIILLIDIDLINESFINKEKYLSISRPNLLTEYTSHPYSQEDFIKNEDVKEVICFNLFQIGELANGLSIEFVKEYNGIPWKQIIGMRHRIVNGYDTINLDIVWNTSADSIPSLKEYCSNIVK